MGGAQGAAAQAGLAQAACCWPLQPQTLTCPAPPAAAQVLAWGPKVTGRNAIVHALHGLFRALQAAAAQQQPQAGDAAGGDASGGKPVAVDPTELRDALAALPGQLVQTGAPSRAGGSSWRAWVAGVRRVHSQLPCC